MQAEAESFRKEIETVIEEDELEEVLSATIDIALASPDADWATDCLIRLAGHTDTDVRGNAMTGFAHLAGRFGELSKEKVIPVLQAGLRDPKSHVREQAVAARDELAARLGWSLADDESAS
jgi:hypothetical protein